jgi:superfamily II DNA/RNA helicase
LHNYLSLNSTTISLCSQHRLTYNFCSTSVVNNQYEKNIPIEKLRISKNLKSSCISLNYEYLTPIQENSFPLIAEGINTAIMSETGSGKTLAYCLPIVNHL